MLQNLHEKVQGWLAWVVVGVVASTFILFGVSYYANSRANSNIKATVNGQGITRNDFDSVYRRLKQRTKNLNAESQAVLKAQALEQVVLDTVMQQAGERNKFYISNKQVEESIVNNDDFKVNGVFAAQRFQQLLSSNSFTQSDYVKVMNNGLMNNQVRFSFIGTSFVLQNELQRYIQFANEQRDYSYFELNPSKLSINSKPTEKQLTHYYNSHENLYKTEPKVSIDYIVLSMSDESNKIKIPASEIQDFYNENKSSYMSAAKFQIKRIFLKGEFISPSQPSVEFQKKIQLISKSLKTKPFDKVSETYSDDMFSNKSSTPWLTLAMLDNSVARVAAELPLNKASEAIYTQKGVEFIKVVAKQESKLTPFNKVKESIAKNLHTDKAQHSFQQKAEQLADLSYQNPDNLQNVAEPLELKVMQTSLNSKTEGFKAPLNNASVISAAFSDDVLKEHNNSQPIQLNEDALIVLRVNKYEKSVLKPFSAVKKDIYNHLLSNAQLLKAQNIASELSKGSAASNSKLMADNHLSWQEVKKGLRTASDKVSLQVNDFAFEVKPKKGLNIQSKGLETGNIAIVNLKAVIAGKLDDVTKEQRKLLENQLASKYGINTYELYVQRLKQEAKVDVIQ